MKALLSSASSHFNAAHTTSNTSSVIPNDSHLFHHQKQHHANNDIDQRMMKKNNFDVGMEEQSRQKQMNEMLYGNGMDKERWVNEEKITYFSAAMSTNSLVYFFLYSCGVSLSYFNRILSFACAQFFFCIFILSLTFLLFNYCELFRWKIQQIHCESLKIYFQNCQPFDFYKNETHMFFHFELKSKLFF